jgi:hypothetical protein
MSYRSAFQRSLDDNLKPCKKSYSKCELEISLIKVEDIFKKAIKTDAEERMVKHEITKEKIQEVILLENAKAQGLTLWQIRDMFDDMGFNCDIFFQWERYSDLNAIYNIGGYITPFYKQLVDLLIGKKSKFYKFLLYKVSLGKGRFHLRFYDNGDGGWYIAAHIDEVNWMNIFASRKHHSKKGGEGDYETGTYVLHRMLQHLKKTIEKNEIFEMDANEIIKEYREKQKLDVSC